ncbi:MAG: FHA domain-containing protein [Myxococcales bacterium]|nr:FHA domain-containing protein [Myxococcales bacterium]
MANYLTLQHSVGGIVTAPIDPSTTTAPRLNRTRRHRPSAVWRLHVLASADPRHVGQVIELPPGTTVLGRRPDPAASAICIDDALLSRNHASLTVVGDDTVAVCDIRSRNGTYANGHKVGSGHVGSGAVLRVGDTVLVLELDPQLHSGYARSTAAVPGVSVAARAVRAALHAASADLLPVLLGGETGTGKELAAVEVHRLSGRKGPLVRVNVTALPEALFEAELFGHARGAFTGAVAAAPGRFREANGGTLVLDEIGDLLPTQQPKLLRVIEDRIVRGVGANVDIALDVKVVASTHIDLPGAVVAGRFRQDLLARLLGHTVAIPPLRLRRADLIALADAVRKPRQGFASWSDALDADVVELLALAPWRDNLRELRRLLVQLDERLGKTGLGLSDLPDGPWLEALATQTEPPSAASPGALPLPAPPPRATDPKRHVLSQSPPRADLLALLAQHRGDIRLIAEALHRDRRQIYRWLASAQIGLDVIAAHRSVVATKD